MAGNRTAGRRGICGFGPPRCRPGRAPHPLTWRKEPAGRVRYRFRPAPGTEKPTPSPVPSSCAHPSRAQLTPRARFFSARVRFKRLRCGSFTFMPPELTSETALASQILVIVGQKADARLPSFTSEELFDRATRKQLLDCAQTLGLTGVSKLVKEELADRVRSAFDGLRAAIARSQSASVDGAGGAGAVGSVPVQFD